VSLVRLRWFLTMTAILVATVGVTVVIADRLDAGGGAGDQLIEGPDGTAAPGEQTTTTTTAASTVPAPGQVTVSGLVTGLHLEGAVLEPRGVPTPLTVVSDRGFGNGGEITGVTVEGAAKTIVWDGGRPFLLTAGGELVLDPVRVDLTPEGLRFALSDAVHAFTLGSYQLDTPVAVGARGVAEARDAVTFETTADSRFQPRGDAVLVLAAAAPRRLVGPGTVHLEGTLEVTDAAGTRAAATLDMATGAYDLTLTPAPAGGWTVTATLQGETAAS
jgi:hypothetical protein